MIVLSRNPWKARILVIAGLLFTSIFLSNIYEFYQKNCGISELNKWGRDSRPECRTHGTSTLWGKHNTIFSFILTGVGVYMVASQVKHLRK